MKVFCLVLCIAAAALAADSQSNPEVQIQLGKIRGSVLQSRSGKPIYAYRGIRYAQPPTGQNRFKAPLPVESWSETLDATNDGPACPQPFSNQTESEDCLRLNIYTRHSPSDSQSESNQHDVIVFFHPGNYWSSSAASQEFGPQYLLEKNVVLVTVNNRLGTLGFVSTGDAYAPGNAGLKDQVQALRFVQKYIAQFNGNPNSVTIMGYGAGAMSVSLHLVSPMSNGLFHRAIAMSGAATLQNPLPHSQENLAHKQAELLGCKTDSHQAIFDCLLSKSAEQLGDSAPQLAERQGDPSLIWTPVVEPEISGVERFLPAQPADLIRERKINAVPLLIGINKDEHGPVVINATEQSQQGNNSIFDDYNTNWSKIAPISFYYERNGSRSTRISKELQSNYFNNQPISSSNARQLGNIYSDVWVNFPVYRYVKLAAEYSSQSVYYYHFTSEGRYSFAKWSNGSNYGVAHQDDLLYLFNISSYPQITPSESKEFKTLQRYTALIANFARTGQPIPQSGQNYAGSHDNNQDNDSDNNADLSSVNFQPSTAAEPRYLEIGENLQMKSGYINAERMNKLEELFPLPAIGQSDNQYPNNQQFYTHRG
ncbi:hypothetical protein PV328_007428 [Microctonus aethiopoides]|uniref:Carboxylesterase type B domain-containing protein n=1 Tax=Microctonus aethiopoides TaxID=144406 RepID=A0AA39EZH1_9HYME|nr:hypothetical protein PV328_007428 [Microctonus aethiopoides]